MEGTVMVNAMAQYGPLAVIIAFFLWRDYKRDQTNSAAYTSCVNYIQTTLTQLSRDCVQAITNNNALLAELKVRPCMAKFDAAGHPVQPKPGIPN
jgi:hypothetical protein